jgi:hypothetical protein
LVYRNNQEKIMPNILKMMALTIVGAAMSAPIAAAPPAKPSPQIMKLIDQQIGTWKLNLKESRGPDGLPYKSGFTVVIRSGYPIQDYTYIGDAVGDEKPFTFSFKGVPDGVVHPNGTDGHTYSMELLPNGIVDAKLWSPDGELENKFCIPYASMVKIICLATITDKDGKRTMFTNILDKQVKP